MNKRYLPLLIIFIIILIIGSFIIVQKIKEKPYEVEFYKIKGAVEYSIPIFYIQLLNIPKEQIIVKTYFVENAKASDILALFQKELSNKGYKIEREPIIQSISTPQGFAE